MTNQTNISNSLFDLLTTSNPDVGMIPKRRAMNCSYNAVTNAFLIMGVLIITVNILVLILITTRTRKLLKNSSNSILMSLSVNDLLTGCCMVMLMINRVENRCTQEVLYSKLAAFSYFLLKFCLLNSIVHLVLLATERMISIHSPLRHRVIVTKHRTHIIILVSWIISAVLSPTEKYFAKDTDSGKVASIVLFVVFLIIPSIIIIVQYLIMLVIIFQYSDNRRHMSTGSFIVKKQKPLLIYLFMFVCFLLLAIPNFIVILYDVLKSDMSFMRDHRKLMIILGFMRLVPCLLNPFIYSLSKEDFQKELKHLARKISGSSQEMSTSGTKLTERKNKQQNGSHHENNKSNFNGNHQGESLLESGNKSHE